MNKKQKVQLQILLIQYIRREFPDLPDATDKGTVRNSFALSLADFVEHSIDMAVTLYEHKDATNARLLKVARRINDEMLLDPLDGPFEDVCNELSSALDAMKAADK